MMPEQQHGKATKAKEQGRWDPYGEWISVKERLPETSGPYLYWCPHLEEYMTNWGIATYFYGGLWGTGCSERITHWMPLPDPPKEGRP